MKPSNDPMDVVHAVKTLFGKPEITDAMTHDKARDTLNDWRRTILQSASHQVVADNCNSKPKVVIANCTTTLTVR